MISTLSQRPKGFTDSGVFNSLNPPTHTIN